MKMTYPTQGREYAPPPPSQSPPTPLRLSPCAGNAADLPRKRHCRPASLLSRRHDYLPASETPLTYPANDTHAPHRSSRRDDVRFDPANIQTVPLPPRPLRTTHSDIPLPEKPSVHKTKRTKTPRERHRGNASRILSPKIPPAASGTLLQL